MTQVEECAKAGHCNHAQGVVSIRDTIIIGDAIFVENVFCSDDIEEVLLSSVPPLSSLFRGNCSNLAILGQVTHNTP